MNSVIRSAQAGAAATIGRGARRAGLAGLWISGMRDTALLSVALERLDARPSHRGDRSSQIDAGRKRAPGEGARQFLRGGRSTTAARAAPCQAMARDEPPSRVRRSVTGGSGAPSRPTKTRSPIDGRHERRRRGAAAGSGRQGNRSTTMKSWRCPRCRPARATTGRPRAMRACVRSSWSCWTWSGFTCGGPSGTAIVTSIGFRLGSKLMGRGTSALNRQTSNPRLGITGDSPGRLSRVWTALSGAGVRVGDGLGVGICADASPPKTERAAISSGTPPPRATRAAISSPARPTFTCLPIFIAQFLSTPCACNGWVRA